MLFLFMAAVYAALLFFNCFLLCTMGAKQAGRKNSRSAVPFAALLQDSFYVFGTAFLLRLALAYFTEGNATDINCFGAWADRMFALGPGAFYSKDVFTDYPPGYMYILWPIGAVRSLFRGTGIRLLLLKLPSILCDMAAGYLVYREGGKRFSKAPAAALAAAYLFNPAIILNSSIWGQVDSVFTLALLLLCLALAQGKMPQAYLAFGAGLLLKPQMLLFAPVLLAGILDQVFLKDFTLKKLLYNLASGMGVILGMLAACLPFGLGQVLAQYTDTVASYPYASVNAYNVWSLLGLNWAGQEGLFMGIPYRVWGGAAVFLAVVCTLALSLRLGKSSGKYPLLCAFLILTIFTFSVRMHERYLYPGLVCLLFAYLYCPAPSMYLCYGGFSVMHLYNTAHILYFYDPAVYDVKSQFVRMVSLGTVCCLCYLYMTLYKIYFASPGMGPAPSGTADSLFSPLGKLSASAKPSVQEGLPASESLSAALRGEPASPQASVSYKEPSRRLNLKDLLLLFLIMAVYSAFALYDLGERTAPETTFDLNQGQCIELRFQENEHPVSLSYYIAPEHHRTFTLEGMDSPPRDSWMYYGDIYLENVFTWTDIKLDSMVSPGEIQALRLTLTDNAASIIELVFLDENGQVIRPENASDYPELFDENSLHPARMTFRNSMYFDEIYHARTAYEFLHGLRTYENTHPPLGKIFISAGIALFGMNPFGWRIVGTLFGIAMLPFLYLFAKKLTGSTPVAALSCILFAFDFMHFAQTRIATIDVYITFFVLLMYYFMYSYIGRSFYDTPLRRTFLPLGASGICMGLGIACKWTGVYAGAGLAVLFFATLHRRYREYKYAKKYPKGITDGILHREVIRLFLPNTVKTICFCLVFFVAIPAAIYLLSYLPFRTSDTNAGLFARMLENQTSMFNYHSTLNDTHAYSSPWYQWPAMVRPIWYYSGVMDGTMREGISAFGNPLVWWAGIPAFLFMLHLAVSQKDRTAAILVISYLAQYLPWCFVSRITFIYHYFPCVPFVVLMIAHGLMQLKRKLSPRMFLLLTAAYGICAFGLFLLFLPVLSGQPVDAAFVDTYLRWFKTWVLVAR